MNTDGPPFSLLGRLPTAFERRVVAVAPGDTIPYHDAEWRGAIVVVERGQVELIGLDNSRHRFARGDVIWLSGLPIRALHNAESAAAVLVAVSRRAAEADR